MEARTILYTFFAMRHFIPMTIFMTPFLIETKKFKNKEIFNSITPFFFIASLFASLLGPIVVSLIGNKYTILLDTGLEMLTYVIFFCMPERNFFLASITGILHGVVTSFGSLSKGILLDHKKSLPVEEMYRNHQMIKKIFGVISSWLGQDMKYATGTHRCNLIFSSVTLFLSFIICLFIPDAVTKHKKNLLTELQNDIFGQIRSIYTRDVLFFSILNVIGSSLYISFAMYSASIFIQRKKEVDPNALFLGRVMYRCTFWIRYLTKILATVIGFFDSSVVYQPKYEKNTIIFGYIDGLAKFVAIVTSYILTVALEKQSALHFRCFISTAFVMVFTFLLGTTKSLMTSYIMYILGSVSSFVSMIWAYNGLSVDKEVVHIIFGLNLVVSSLIHISISYYTKYTNKEVNSKIMTYFWVNSVLLTIALAIQLLHK